MTSHLHPFALRILAALGTVSAVSCGGIAVIDPDGTGGTAGTGGAGGTAGTGGTAGAAGTGGVPSGCGDPPPPPPGYVSFDTCVGSLGESCPTAAEIDWDLIENALPNCTSDPDFCWCEKTIVTVSCAYTKGNDCCYTGAYSAEEWCEGRPFVVAGSARVACPVLRADWGGANASWSDLSEDLRTELAAEWLRDALAEHASVASFARHALELLAVGAPAELVSGAIRAMGDEIEHARLCFALASRHAGHTLGPGPLETGGALDGSVDLAEVAAATVRDGCVNETLSAMIAAAMRDAAKDPEARAALDRIAEDEARHAELAWRFVGWAIEKGGERVRAAVERAFAAAPAFAARGATTAALGAHGRLTSAEIALLVQRATHAVIRPCAAALCAVPVVRVALRA